MMVFFLGVALHGRLKHGDSFCHLSYQQVNCPVHSPFSCPLDSPLPDFQTSLKPKYWVYIEVILGLYWVCIGVILGLYWSYIRFILGLYIGIMER